MSDPFLAEIRMFAGNFAPNDWAFCNGQLLQIAQNTALYSLLGVTYGGDGRTTFGLPNLQAASPMHQGEGPNLTPRKLGEEGGSAQVTLLSAQMATHNHAMTANSFDAADNRTPSPTMSLAKSSPGNAYASKASAPVAMAASAVSVVGGDQAHNNRQPYLAVSFIICLRGIFPQRP